MKFTAVRKEVLPPPVEKIVIELEPLMAYFLWKGMPSTTTATAGAFRYGLHEFLLENRIVNHAGDKLI